VVPGQKSVADLLRELREEKGESLRAAARGIGVDPAHLQRVETGAKPPSDAFAEKASAYYDVEPEVVLLAAGQLPPDVVEYLLTHPEELKLLQEKIRE
jgi:transcriptional regulator with XRE-family HTH domain